LADELDAWLNAGFKWRNLLFPRRLRGQFDADTREERSRVAGLTSLVGAGAAVLLYPVLAAAAPDMQAISAWLFLGVAVPFTIALSIAVLLNPRPWLREVFLALPVAVDASVLTYIFAKTRADAAELYVVAIILMLVYATVTVQIRFATALAVSLYALGIYAWCFTTQHPQDALHPDFLVALTAAIAAYLLLGNWRMHADQRRGYALMLREKLRQHTLAVQNQALDELARQDPLTGLANRRAYDVWLEDLWQQALTGSAPLGLIMIDIDRFKAFNDINGHPAGDACLRTIANCLRDSLAGVSDCLARLGGEEFAVLLPGHDEASCIAIAERLRRAAETLGILHPALGAGRTMTLSCGVASLQPGESISAGMLCDAADAALYRAKQAGRNCVRGGDTASSAPMLRWSLTAMPVHPI
jgi:diguanylate cyclase (GGDEF)-like protein